MSETVLDPDLPIIDSHHHFFPHNDPAAGGGRYMLEEYAADIADGHNVQASVFIECSQFYRQTGPEALRPRGEAEFAMVLGRISDTGCFGRARICAGIVAAADLTLGDAVEDVLAVLHDACDGRMRGIRCPTNWDPDPQVNPSSRPFAPQGLMADPTFRAGAARLSAAGLVYEGWQYHPQLSELAELADALPDLTIVCDHCGGLVGKRAYANPGNFDAWRGLIQDLAARPNVVMKLGGLANERTGFNFQERAVPATEAELAQLWGPYIESCIEAFGPQRCMFGSNFPIDLCATSFRSLWNVFKSVVAGYSPDERTALFSGTARRTYKLETAGPGHE